MPVTTLPTAILSIILSLTFNAVLPADEKSADVSWRSDSSLLRPFWTSDTVEGESLLFIQDPATGEASANLLFPVDEVINVTRAVDWKTSNGISFESGRDYVWKPGSHEITLPKDSRIPSYSADALRRPAGSQKYKLTHRDGNGEILFGATDEYHQMQVCITYRHKPAAWPTAVPSFDEAALPKTIQKLRKNEAVSIVLLGDSISTGCNASGWADVAPHQPPYQDMLLQHLKETYSQNITLTGLARISGVAKFLWGKGLARRGSIGCCP